MKFLLRFDVAVTKLIVALLIGKVRRDPHQQVKCLAPALETLKHVEKFVHAIGTAILNFGKLFVN